MVVRSIKMSCCNKLLILFAIYAIYQLLSRREIELTNKERLWTFVGNQTNETVSWGDSDYLYVQDDTLCNVLVIFYTQAICFGIIDVEGRNFSVHGPYDSFSYGYHVDRVVRLEVKYYGECPMNISSQVISIGC